VPLASVGPALLAHAVQPAPPALAASVASAALAGAAASASGASIAKGALAAMAWTNTKLAAAVAAGVILAAGGTTAVVALNSKPTSQTVSLTSANLPPLPADWKSDFERTYALADGQDAKFVGPPFGPEREAWMRANKMAWNFPQQCFTFQWDGTPHWSSASINPDLDFVMSLGVGLDRSKWRDPKGLLRTPLAGDWVFRKGAPLEAKLNAFAAVLSERLGRNVRFEKKPAPQQPDDKAPPADVWELVVSDIGSDSPMAWRTRFDQVYGLAPGEAMKRVEPPFIPEREAFWAETQRQLNQPKPLVANRDDFALGLEWEGEVPRWIYAGGNLNLGYAMQSVVGLQTWEFDESVPRDLKLPGDWVTRHGATVEEKLASLAPIASKQLGRPVHFEKRTGPREAIVVRGSYRYAPLWTAGSEEVIELWDTTPPGNPQKPVLNSTPLSTMWGALQYRLERRVYDESAAGTTPVKWRDHLYTADRDALLRNLSKQTGLTFEREPRVMEYWVMIEGPSK
jgi:hypothetical protein